MSKKNKSLLIFLLIIALTSIGESLFPIFPFIGIGCFLTYLLGRWEKENNI